jgi:O-antigen ligase
MGIFFCSGLDQWMVHSATLQEASSAGHVAEWKQSLDSLWTTVAGTGLGTAGFVGSRFKTIMGGENQYLIIGVELGWIGAGLFVAILLALFGMLWYAAYTLKDDFERQVAIGVMAAALGIVLVGITSQVYLNSFLIMTAWWLAGWVMQRRAQDQAPHAHRS